MPAYARPASKFEACTRETHSPGGTPAIFAVTLFHVFPPSRVICTRPSSVAALGFAVEDVGVGRIDGGPEAVAAVGEEPVGVGDAAGGGAALAGVLTAGAAARGDLAAPRAVVLQAAADRVRLIEAVADVVELAEGDVVLEVPGLRLVVREVDAAVGAEEDVAGVGGI